MPKLVIERSIAPGTLVTAGELGGDRRQVRSSERRKGHAW
jgi:hypothetical protein